MFWVCRRNSKFYAVERLRMAALGLFCSPASVMGCALRETGGQGWSSWDRRMRASWRSRCLGSEGMAFVWKTEY